MKGDNTDKNIKKDPKENMTFRRAEKEGTPVFLWDSMLLPCCIIICSTLSLISSSLSYTHP